MTLNKVAKSTGKSQKYVVTSTDSNDLLNLLCLAMQFSNSRKKNNLDMIRARKELLKKLKMDQLSICYCQL